MACSRRGAHRVPPSLPIPRPCATLTGHACHLPRQAPLRYHCAPRIREMKPRRVPRTKQKIMGRFPASRAGSGAKAGPVGTVRGGSALRAGTGGGIVTSGLRRGGGAPRGERGCLTAQGPGGGRRREGREGSSEDSDRPRPSPLLWTRPQFLRGPSTRAPNPQWARERPQKERGQGAGRLSLLAALHPLAQGRAAVFLRARGVSALWPCPR